MQKSLKLIHNKLNFLNFTLCYFGHSLPQLFKLSVVLLTLAQFLDCVHQLMIDSFSLVQFLFVFLAGQGQVSDL
jgi:hypothetical protein